MSNRLNIIIFYVALSGGLVLVLLPVELMSLFLNIYCRDQFIDYWIRGNMLAMDLTTQIYTILKQPYRTYLAQVCFLLYAVIPVIQRIFAIFCISLWTVRSFKIIIKIAFGFSILIVGWFQTCPEGTIVHSSWIGVFAKHAWISGKIWYGHIK